MREPLHGRCLCGAVRYRISSEPLSQSLCHCPSCRLAAGASPVGWLVVRRQAFAFVLGQPVRYGSSTTVERTFCAVCGTALTYEETTSPDTIDVTSATLEDQTMFAPTREVWVEYRPRWLPAVPGLAQFAQGSSDAAAKAG
jgi:hypothetical protein